jgi:trigger factor
LQQLAGPIFEDKVIDYILELAKVTEVTTDTDTLYKAPEEVAPAKKTAKKAAKKPAAKKPADKKKAAAKKAPAKKVAKKTS